MVMNGEDLMEEPNYMKTGNLKLDDLVHLHFEGSSQMCGM